MRSVVWISAAIAGTTTAVVMLLSKRGDEPAAPPQPPPRVYGETVRVALPVPAGWRRATSSEVQALPELSAQARALRNSSGFTSLPYGSLYPLTASNGETYATWVEQHYNEPGGPAQPWGYHHGVTVLARSGAA